MEKRILKLKINQLKAENYLKGRLVAEGYDENLLDGIRLNKHDLDELCKTILLS